MSAVRIRDFPTDVNRNEEVLSVDHSRLGLVIIESSVESVPGLNT